MGLSRRDGLVLGAAALLAVALPLWLLQPAATVPSAGEPAPLVLPAAPPPVSAAYARALFGDSAAPAEEAPLPEGAPQLIGIVGRIGSDAVAMVRTADGSGRTLQTGESVDGWTLESLAIDAAFFTRGTQRARVPLPAGDAG